MGGEGGGRGDARPGYEPGEALDCGGEGIGNAGKDGALLELGIVCDGSGAGIGAGKYGSTCDPESERFWDSDKCFKKRNNN